MIRILLVRPAAMLPSLFPPKWFGIAYLTSERMSILKNILMKIRLPLIFAASLIGATLSVSGAAFQAMFVNPLASPSLLGVLGGASLGAALGIIYLKSWYLLQIATFTCNITAVIVVFGIARHWPIGLWPERGLRSQAVTLR